MKILLTTLNSKFVHSNLAIRYLKAFCRELPVDIKIQEFTINDHLGKVLWQIYREKPDVLCFSCYIWNIRESLMLVDSLKKVLPTCKVVLGGPEVSFDSYRLMEEYPAIDIIVRGEGEETFYELVKSMIAGESLDGIKGLSFRDGNDIYENEERPTIKDLDNIPFPYDLDEEGYIVGVDNKIIYYETSRGCPFNCQYCLSSATSGVRYFSLERVKKDLEIFIKSKIPQVKLVDRTFNCNPSRAMEIFKTIMDMGGETNFHFEMGGDLIDDEMLKLLEKAPPGLFQFEIGVQSTKEETLEAIKRKNDFEKLAKAVQALQKGRNIHLHLDLIAGLPEEGYNSFKQSFNDVYKLKPDRLQLGFLKLLKGSGLRNNASQWDYKYTSYPPYEVLENRYISYGEILTLKGIEDLLEKYYNSHRFRYSLDYLVRYFDDNPFKFFESFNRYWEERDYHVISHSLIRLYEILLEFVEQLPNIDKDLLKEIIKFDYVSQGRPGKYPRRLGGELPKEIRDKISLFFKDKKKIARYLPKYEHLTARQIARTSHIEIFRYDIPEGIKTGSYKKADTAVLFDYNLPCKIFERSRWIRIEL